jgi:hypothetical protein
MVVLVSKATSVMPKQEAFAGSFNTAQEVSPGNGLLGSFRADHLAQLNRNKGVGGLSTNLRWSGQSANAFSALAAQPQPQWAGQFATQPQQTELLIDTPSSFVTEPLQTERTPLFSAPEGIGLPSTPVPQEVIPSTATELWEQMSEVEMSDPLLEAMMHQVRAGLYIVPQREGE